MSWGLRLPRLSLFALLWHFILIIICSFNSRYFMLDEESMLGQAVPRIHMAFNIIGFLAYVFVASVLIFWPYRYGAYLLPHSRRNRMLAGIAVVYFLHVLPCWMMEFAVVWVYGWFTLLQGTSFILLIITWIIETVIVWLGYIWHMSGFINRNYGHTRFGQGYSSVPPDS